MQTFLPYPDFVPSAQVLDNKRLGKQRVEVLQILNTLHGKSKGWKNHPAVLMWAGSERLLALYGIIICSEWTRRGFKDNVKPQLQEYFNLHLGKYCPDPKWLGDFNFHYRHQANLLRKDFDHYSKYFGTVINPYLNYHWPVRINKK